jgi:hypothetical protein
MPEHEEEIIEYCDCENCMHPSKPEYWVQYKIVHNAFLTTNAYAHFCHGHYQAFNEHVFTIEIPLPV